MMLIMSVVYVFKTWNRYIRLAESLCSLNYVQTYVFQIREENLHDIAHFRGYQLFLGWFQVMSVVSWLVSDNSWTVSGDFYMVSGRSRLFLVLVSTQTSL